MSLTTSHGRGTVKPAPTRATGFTPKSRLTAPPVGGSFLVGRPRCRGLCFGRLPGRVRGCPEFDEFASEHACRMPIGQGYPQLEPHRRPPKPSAGVGVAVSYVFSDAFLVSKRIAAGSTSDSVFVLRSLIGTYPMLRASIGFGLENRSPTFCAATIRSRSTENGSAFRRPGAPEKRTGPENDSRPKGVLGRADCGKYPKPLLLRKSREGGDDVSPLNRRARKDVPRQPRPVASIQLASGHTLKIRLVHPVPHGAIENL